MYWTSAGRVMKVFSFHAFWMHGESHVHSSANDLPKYVLNYLGFYNWSWRFHYSYYSHLFEKCFGKHIGSTVEDALFLWKGSRVQTPCMCSGPAPLGTGLSAVAQALLQPCVSDDSLMPLFSIVGLTHFPRVVAYLVPAPTGCGRSPTGCVGWVLTHTRKRKRIGSPVERAFSVAGQKRSNANIIHSSAGHELKSSTFTRWAQVQLCKPAAALP